MIAKGFFSAPISIAQTYDVITDFILHQLYIYNIQLIYDIFIYSSCSKRVWNMLVTFDFDDSSGCGSFDFRHSRTHRRRWSYPKKHGALQKGSRVCFFGDPSPRTLIFHFIGVIFSFVSFYWGCGFRTFVRFMSGLRTSASVRTCLMWETERWWSRMVLRRISSDCGALGGDLQEWRLILDNRWQWINGRKIHDMCFSTFWWIQMDF